ncbi:MAG: CGGC domain-containing protein [Desulfovibrionaceae bacterium]|nr:CGGC domain-containing protein [Desulfovibrionaceae bacterium]
MKKVGIIRCQQTEDLCPGTTDFVCALKGKGAFEELGPCEVIGFVSCGGCPGKRAVARAKMLVDRGAEAIALASCITKGNPLGFPCPHRDMMLQSILGKLGEDFPVLDYTH